MSTIFCIYSEVEAKPPKFSVFVEADVLFLTSSLQLWLCNPRRELMETVWYKMVLPYRGGKKKKKV